jgi:two-component system LytT family response regulator
MIQAIIVDDMPAQRRNLINLLNENHPEIKIVQECNNADEGMEAISKHHPALVFLDVEMPGKTGFELVAELKETAYNLDIIFTTAHEQYALQAIKASALDFLLKPVSENDLREALAKLDRKKTKDQVRPGESTIAQQIQILLQQNTNNPFRKIALPTLTGFVFVNVNDIVRCEADNVYTTFHMADKTTIVVSKTLKDCEELLPERNFFRIHHSHLINMKYIKEYMKGEGGAVKMTVDDTSIPVSRNKKDEFLARMKNL